MKKVICIIALITCVLSANAQWIHSPLWKLGGNPAVGGSVGALAIWYNSTDFRLLLPVTDGEIPNRTTKIRWNNWSWWYPLFNYEIPVAIGPNITSASGKVESKGLSTVVGAIGYQFGYFPKGSFPIGARAKFLFQEEAFTIKMPGEENFFCHAKSSIVPSGDIFIRIGSYAINHFNAVIIGGLEYKKTIGYEKKQWEKTKLFSFKSSEPGYPYEKEDKSILNSGWTGNIGAGIINARTGRMVTITYQKEFFDFFNTDYVNPDGDKPYKEVKSNNGYISINVCFVP